MTEVEHAALAIGQGPLSVELALLPIAFVSATIDKGDFTLSAFFVRRPLTFIPVSVLVNLSAKALFDNLACVYTAIVTNCDNFTSPIHSTLTVVDCLSKDLWVQLCFWLLLACLLIFRNNPILIVCACCRAIHQLATRLEKRILAGCSSQSLLLLHLQDARKVGLASGHEVGRMLVHAWG